MDVPAAYADGGRRSCLAGLADSVNKEASRLGWPGQPAAPALAAGTSAFGHRDLS
jgi:hypothetical protein